MAKVKQEYVLEVTAKGLKEVVNEIKALRADLATANKSAGGVADGLGKSGKAAGDAASGYSKASKSAGEYDRNAKGAAKATNNSTKAFSKMSQGMSGTLVPAYATVAANVFALSAAFGALERAADVQILIKASEELATQTGRSLTSLAKDMKEIAGGAISMKEALTQASLAASAGFDNTSIEKLTQVARNASVALGRDLTDSMNRVFKGAIKAEPELLDELGIILRLEPAVKKYAASLNKSVTELTTFERQQAILNEVVEQGTEKFGLLSDVDPNPYTKLAAAFSDVVTSLIKLVNVPISPVISWFSENIGALTAAVLIFANSVASRAIPAIADLGKSFSGKITKEFDNISSGLEVLTSKADRWQTLAGKFKSSSDVIISATNSLDTEIKEYADDLDKIAPNISEKYNNILGRGLTTTGIKSIIEETKKDIASIGKTMQGNSAVAARAKEGLQELRLQAEAYEKILKKVEAGETNVSLKREINIERLKTLGATTAANIKLVKLAFGVGFGTGFSESLSGIILKLQEIQSSFIKTAETATFMTRVFQALTVASYTLGAALGFIAKWILRLIPILGQIYIAWEILSTIFGKITDYFKKDALGSKAATTSLESYTSAVEEAAKISISFKDQFKKGIVGFNEQAKAALIQRNSLNNLNTSLIETIGLVEDYNETWLERLGEDNTDILKENLEASFTVLKNLGKGESIKSLEEQLKTADTKEAVLEIAKSFVEVNKTIINSTDLIVEFSDRLKTSADELDKSLSNIVTNYVKVSDEQKAIGELSNVLAILGTETFTNVDVLDKAIGGLTESSASLIGFSSEYLHLITETSGEIKQTKNELDALVAKQNELKDKFDLSSSYSIDKLQVQINQKQQYYNSLKSKSNALSDIAINKLTEAKNLLVQISQSEAYIATERAKLEFSLKNSVLSYEKQLVLVRKLNELDKYEINIKSALQQKLKKSYEESYKLAEDRLGITNRQLLATSNEEDREKLILLQRQQSLSLAEAEIQVLNQQVQANKDKTEQIKAQQNYLLEVESLYNKLNTQIILGAAVSEESIETVKTEWIKAIKELAITADLNFEQLFADRELAIRLNISEVEFSKIGATPTLESTIQTEISQQEQTELYNLQQQILLQTGEILDENYNKEYLINDLLFQREAIRLQEKLDAAVTQDQYNTFATLLENNEKRRLAAVEQIRQEEKTAADSRLSALNKSIELEQLSAKYSSAKTQEERKLLAVQLARAKTNKEITDDEIKAIKELENIKFANNFKDIFDTAVKGSSALYKVFDDLITNLDGLNTPFEKMQAGILAIAQVAEETGDKTAKAFSGVSLVFADFAAKTKAYNEDQAKAAELQEGIVKPDDLKLATDAMGALAGAFGEGTVAAKAFQLAQQGVILSNAIAAITGQGTDPVTGWARMAAMASAMASLLSVVGLTIGGTNTSGSSGTTAADYKASTFGTNDIQGYDTRDNTLGEGLQGLIDINTKLFSAEQDLQIAIKNLSKSFDIVGAQLFKAGGSFDVGSIAQKFGLTFGTKLDPGFLGAFDETVTKDLLAGGVQLGVAIEEVAGSLVGSIKNARLFITQQITEVDSGFFGIGGGTDVDIVTVFRGISEELESSLNKSLNASLNVLVGLVDNFGLDVEETFKDLQLNIPTTQINLEGKSAEEQSALIGKFLTGVVNDVIQESVPWVAKYTQANEDLLATLARLVEQTIIINDAFSIFGQTIDSIASISLTANLSAYETEVIQPFEEESANLANALEQAQEALSFTLTRASNNTTWWGNVIAQLEDRFVDFNEVYAYFEQVSQAGGEGGLGGNISDEAGLIINDYKRYINDLTDTLTNLSVLSFSEWFESVKVAWEEALLGEFGGDQEFFTQTAQKFAKALYSEEELATFAKETATIIVEQGLSTISEQLADTDFSIGAITADVEDIPAFRQLYEDLIDAGVFAGEAGAVLQAAFLKTGAAFGDLIEKVEEFDNAIGNFIRDLERQIAAFGLYGKELDLLQLQFDYEDTLEEARKLGADLALVEELFGLKRIDILRQYNQEIVDNITNTSKAISDAMISVVDSNEAWDYVAYQSLRVEKAADRLKTSLGNLTSDIDFSVFNSDVDTSNFEQLFSSILKFEEDIPTNINDQIALVNQLKDAVLDRYNAEGQAVSNLKDLATDIADFLDSLKLSELSPLTNVERLAEAQRQFTNNLNNLNSDDAEIRAKAQKDLTSSANTYLESAKEYYGISVGFQDVFKNVTSALQATQDSLTSGVGLTPDTLAINVLQQQTLDQLATLDEILYTLEASNAVDYQIEIEAWAAAIGDGSTLNSIEVKLGSLEDAIWATTIANIPEYNTGTSEIEFDQIAKVHKGEMILTPTTSEEVRSGETFITNSTNTTYAGANGESIGTEEIVNAIRILTEVLAVSQEDLLEQGEKMINQASQTKSLNPTPARTSGLV